ncbi:helix-turn-helix transcriptional regulator [Polynucleobacter sp. MWH-Mekk-B1]|uniref:helix-turn-helix domain-containing protein n=1 Tax=Polynucleobacter finlandensis TaxID=1855894 RepID=UPI001C0AF336|nr:helix-turn-helix transcriptional regulator [Polynucleobacter finlandensis]MBU3544164.1 helix-turn-helix transcriptional regulator [Polynucleobacter finlandensis]
MSNGKTLVQIALEILKCNQTELAVEMGVSKVQISKWKNGESMSAVMEKKLRYITQAGDLDPDFVISCGSVDDAKKWAKLITYQMYNNEAELDYGIEDEAVCAELMRILALIGVNIPKPFPQEFILKWEYEDMYDHYGEENDEIDAVIDAFEGQPLIELIRSIFDNYACIDHFIGMYISNLGLNHPNFQNLEAKQEILHRQLELATAKVNVNKEIAPLFGKFKFITMSDFSNLIGEIKVKAYELGLPLEAELNDLITENPENIKDDTNDRDMWIFKSQRSHPDIYMNELLEGMRAIHAVLPLILKKLDIDQEEINTAVIAAP